MCPFRATACCVGAGRAELMRDVYLSSHVRGLLHQGPWLSALSSKPCSHCPDNLRFAGECTDPWLAWVTCPFWVSLGIILGCALTQHRGQWAVVSSAGVGQSRLPEESQSSGEGASQLALAQHPRGFGLHSGWVLLVATAVLAVSQHLFQRHPYRSDAGHLLPSPLAHLLQFLEPSPFTSPKWEAE